VYPFVPGFFSLHVVFGRLRHAVLCGYGLFCSLVSCVPRCEYTTADLSSWRPALGCFLFGTSTHSLRTCSDGWMYTVVLDAHPGAELVAGLCTVLLWERSPVRWYSRLCPQCCVSSTRSNAFIPLYLILASWVIPILEFPRLMKMSTPKKSSYNICYNMCYSVARYKTSD